MSDDLAALTGYREMRLRQERLAAAPPGARELISQAARWAVVTSAHRQLAQVRLQTAGLPMPPILVCGDKIARGKPDAEGYLKAAALLALEPYRCLVLEDAPAGIEAARRAGMPVIALTTTHPSTAIANPSTPAKSTLADQPPSRATQPPEC